MKTKFALLSLALAITTTAAAVPLELSHQGRLLDSAGAPLQGSQSITFALYDAQGATDADWTEDQTLELTEGYFAATLGSVTPLDTDILSGEALWLSVAVDGVEISDRIRVVSVPYAVRAQVSTNLEGGSVNATSISIDGNEVIDASGNIDFARITSLPDGLADGDADSLADLVCTDAQVVTWSGSSWTCGEANSHQHHADDITEGKLAIERLPVGTTSDTVMPGDKTFSADDVGALPVTGGTLTGELGGTGATFTGDVGAANATFSGDLGAANGSFSGDVGAADGSFSGDITADGGLLVGTDALVVGSVDVGGDLDVAGTITGTGASGLGTFHFLSTPQKLRWTCNGSNQRANDQNPSAVPDDATALITNVFTYHDGRNDHVNHSFGRFASHDGTSWDNNVYTDNIVFNDVLITHNGNNAGSDYYGMAHGTQIVPLKSNGAFDANLCHGRSTGTHYVTMQVNGYIK